ncbi:MAG: pyruvate kinase [Candidatus Omnitrophota bacterium]|jgi:pyruvate kinase
MVKTKIICTLGPASSNETTARKMMLAGMDVARLNFSHGKLQEMFHRIALIRRLNANYRRRVKLLGDLQGHRIRVGDIPEPIMLKKRQTVWLTQQKIKGRQGKLPFDYKGPLSGIKNGQHIFIDDGTIALEVVGRNKDSLKTIVIVGGLIKEHKGVNIPGAKLEFGPISRKDIQDIIFCEKNGIEYIAQSFVCSKKDVLDVRKILKKGSKCRIVSKIESREGIKNIDEIIGVSDGIMIARGDMGVSLPVYEVPIIQKMIIKKCNRAGKFVITATQMLESMTANLIPTRAEVTDVANAIIDGTDLVMLSAETAVGKHPAESVAMMNEIIKFTEKNYRSIG